MATKNVLIIDDESDIREIAKMSLQLTRSWNVEGAGSGKEGLAIAIDKQPDVILLDIIMPEMDGLTTLKLLKENPFTQQIPVILLTATVKVATKQQYALLGAKAVMIKPFDPGILADQIETAVGWKIIN
ncbi:response regulator [Phormidium sp. LEGE 05292]|uniref:response regulator n=1 Tax=[Phormidium] sp. LEGE 05292 TaxID=767427 RepID=UPI0018825D64|nr:response regulator [Phormidium sp. LEGE 05292]MBE9225463.1 response regulator [Phormidium sp. LEGE 05292]